MVLEVTGLAPMTALVGLAVGVVGLWALTRRARRHIDLNAAFSGKVVWVTGASAGIGQALSIVRNRLIPSLPACPTPSRPTLFLAPLSRSLARRIACMPASPAYIRTWVECLVHLGCLPLLGLNGPKNIVYRRVLEELNRHGHHMYVCTHGPDEAMIPPTLAPFSRFLSALESSGWPSWAPT